MNVPLPQPWFENPASGESGVAHGLPDDGDHCGVGVVRIEDGGFGLPVLLHGQQVAQLLALAGEGVVARIEYLGYRAPT